MLLECCFVILCVFICVPFLFPRLLGAVSFEFCGEPSLLLLQPTLRMQNKKHSVFEATLLAKRDLLFEMIAQSELSELCVFHKSGKRTFFFSCFTCLEKLRRLNSGTLQAELLNILECLSRVLRSKTRLREGPMSFQGQGHAQRAFLIGCSHCLMGFFMKFACARHCSLFLQTTPLISFCYKIYI